IEPEIMPTCARYGMGLVVWSPLAQGLLTGKYSDGAPAGSRGERTDWLKDDLTGENIDKALLLEKLAGSIDLSLSQLALAWVLRRPEISCAITGATSVKQVEENVIASGVKLTQDVLDEIEAILNNDPTRESV
ncbi:MAG: aldo/keto reductase, partial [candidate division Zixibacteria bacterium]|nr:aldo/keto reductase [candidate division Zixibacteria bacterium]